MKYHDKRKVSLVRAKSVDQGDSAVGFSDAINLYHPISARIS